MSLQAVIIHCTQTLYHKPLDLLPIPRYHYVMEVVNLSQVKSFTTKDTSEIREILAPRNSSIKNQSLAEARIAPGQTTEEHYHLRSEEIYYILRGKGRMWLENESREIQAGDGITIPPGKMHKIENSGQEPMVLLCCCAPAYTDEDTILS